MPPRYHVPVRDVLGAVHWVAAANDKRINPHAMVRPLHLPRFLVHPAEKTGEVGGPSWGVIDIIKYDINLEISMESNFLEKNVDFVCKRSCPV